MVSLLYCKIERYVFLPPSRPVGVSEPESECDSAPRCFWLRLVAAMQPCRFLYPYFVALMQPCRFLYPYLVAVRVGGARRRAHVGERGLDALHCGEAHCLERRP